MARSKRKKRKESRQQNNSAFIQPSDILTPIKPKTEGQQIYLESIEDNIITICDGLAGTGKTFISFYSALKYYLSNNNIDRIVIVRPTFSAGDEPELGFLPGNINEKMSPFLAPLLKDSARQIIKKLKKDYEVQSLLSRGRNSLDAAASVMNSIISKFDIEIVPLQFMRGRTFDRSFVILDEAQNCNMADFKLFLTRIGLYSKVVIEGDASQCDRKDGALVELMDRLEGLDNIGTVCLDQRDIVRSPLISSILERLKKTA